MNAPAPTELLKRIRHAMTTMQNDDLSEPLSEKRDRHVARYETLANVADFLERQAASVGAEVAGEVAKLIERAETFVDHGAASMDEAQELMSDVLLLLKPALASPSRSEGVSNGEVPDWKQDQAETTRLKPRPQCEVNNFETTEAGVIDWKMEAERANRKLAALERREVLTESAPTNRQLHDVIASAIEKGRTYSGIQDAVREIQKLHGAELAHWKAVACDCLESRPTPHAVAQASPVRVDDHMIRARRLVENHIEAYGMVPHPDFIKDAISELSQQSFDLGFRAAGGSSPLPSADCGGGK